MVHLQEQGKSERRQQEVKDWYNLQRAKSDFLQRSREAESKPPRNRSPNGLNLPSNTLRHDHSFSIRLAKHAVCSTLHDLDALPRLPVLRQAIPEKSSQASRDPD